MSTESSDSKTEGTAEAKFKAVYLPNTLKKAGGDCGNDAAQVSKRSLWDRTQRIFCVVCVCVRVPVFVCVCYFGFVVSLCLFSWLLG